MPPPRSLFEHPDEDFFVFLTDVRYQGSGAHADQGGIPTLTVWEADNSSTVTILDDGDAGTVQFALDRDEVHEQNASSVDYVVTVTRVGRAVPSAAITVNISTANGTALGGIDFAESQGLLSFADATTTALFTVTIAHDDLYEVGPLRAPCVCARRMTFRVSQSPRSTRTSTSSSIWRTSSTWGRT